MPYRYSPSEGKYVWVFDSSGGGSGGSGGGFDSSGGGCFIIIVLVVIIAFLSSGITSCQRHRAEKAMEKIPDISFENEVRNHWGYKEHDEKKMFNGIAFQKDCFLKEGFHEEDPPEYYTIYKFPNSKIAKKYMRKVLLKEYKNQSEWYQANRKECKYLKKYAFIKTKDKKIDTNDTKVCLIRYKKSIALMETKIDHDDLDNEKLHFYIPYYGKNLDFYFKDLTYADSSD